jgi:serine acetyltransferase
MLEDKDDMCDDALDVERDICIYVHIVKAEKLKAMDKDGKSDPYCEVSFLNKYHKSIAYENCEDVPFNQAFVFKTRTLEELMNEPLEVSIHDVDKIGSHGIHLQHAELIGKVGVCSV